ncbi:uncharacterized protein M6G45_003325 [Spheniscus humboldti]
MGEHSSPVGERTPEGAKRARVSRLPSLKLLQKELSRRHAWRTFSARSLERLMEGQAEADPKQGPATVPSDNRGGLCRSPGWAAQGRTSPGGARTPAGQRPLDVVLRGHGASAAAHSLEEGRARAGPGCPGGTPALRSLRAGAAEPEPRFQLLAPCPSCCTAQHRAAGRAGQGRLRERWPGGLH